MLTEFPYRECELNHTLDYCFDKECKHLHTNDNGQTYYCDIVFSRLEELHPYPDNEKIVKVPYCRKCNNNKDFIIKGKTIKCSKCNKFVSKLPSSEVDSIMWYNEYIKKQIKGCIKQ